MNNRFAVFDVETPNGNNDTICSIGVVTIQDGVICGKEYYLVNPEAPFDDRCVAIHGIAEADVLDSPTFPEVWLRIKDYFAGYLLVGHNVNFDLSCIRKALKKYNLHADPAYYLDTLTLSRDYVADLENYRLPTLCRYFEVDLHTHHNALCDSLSTAQLLLCLLNNYDIDVDSYIKKFFFEGSRQSFYKTTYTDATKSLQELQGVLFGVASDGELNDREIFAIKRWLLDHEELKGNFPYDKIYSTIKDILADGIISDSERKELLTLMNRILDPVESVQAKNDVKSIQIDGSVICLSGDFECMSKSEFADLLASKGAIIKNNVVKSLDYLIVGGKGSEMWAHGNYGSKVKKAMEYNEKGGSIEILKESDIVPIVLDE